MKVGQQFKELTTKNKNKREKEWREKMRRGHKKLYGSESRKKEVS